MVIELAQNFSLVNSWINELRNVETQNNRNTFRRNMERIGEVAAYHISQDLEV
jgi:uracil phosphoribosyltransferase